jgi:SAM-dependent methyltransferase
MTDYFDNRAVRYLKALDMCPNALEEEYKTAVAQCDLHAGNVLLTIPSSCERIMSYLPEDVRLIQYETTKTLSKLTSIPYCTFQSIPEPSESIDRILCLASLHHLTSEERTAFYKECIRLLRPGGKLIIGDVEASSGLASWLNVFVDKYNPFGHKGIFFDVVHDTEHIRQSGFANVSSCPTSYKWRFESDSELLEFIRELFMLECDDATLLNGIDTYLSRENNTIGMGLLYFICSV